MTVICIIDDDVAIRDSLSLLLYAAGYETCAFESADHYLEAPPGQEIACMLLDIRMPGTDGIDLFKRLQADMVGFPILFITGHGDIPLAVAAIKNGAFDFLTKPFEDGELLAKVEAAVAFQRDNAARREAQAAVRARLSSLTAREHDVMALLVEGHSNKSVADHLEISPRTVEIHRAHVMDKMRADSIASLVRMVTESGVLTD